MSHRKRRSQWAKPVVSHRQQAPSCIDVSATASSNELQQLAVQPRARPDLGLLLFFLRLPLSAALLHVGAGGVGRRLSQHQAAGADRVNMAGDRQQTHCCGMLAPRCSLGTAAVMATP